MVFSSLTLEFDPRNRMRPSFFKSDSNFRLQGDRCPLTLNLTLKVNSCREMDFIFGMGVVTLTYICVFVTIGCHKSCKRISKDRGCLNRSPRRLPQVQQDLHRPDEASTGQSRSPQVVTMFHRSKKVSTGQLRSHGSVEAPTGRKRISQVR